jgi:hypothetical protein
VHIGGERKKVYTRNGLDWTMRFSAIAGAFDVPGRAIVDGEVVVIKDGRTNFSELQPSWQTESRTGWRVRPAVPWRLRAARSSAASATLRANCWRCPAWRANDTAAMRKWLDMISEDGQTPSSLRSRAEALHPSADPRRGEAERTLVAGFRARPICLRPTLSGAQDR